MRQRDTMFDFLLEKFVRLFSAPQPSGLSADMDQGQVPVAARTISETEVPHGAVAGRETQKRDMVGRVGEENRTQGCLQQKQRLTYTVPAGTAAGTSLSRFNPQLLRRMS